MPRPWTFASSLLAIAFACVGCAQQKTVAGQYWIPSQHEAGEPLARFPELATPAMRAARHVGDGARIGLCFSGGGTRSAAATLGYLRALRELPALRDRVEYLSCVSGGAWAAVPYTFLPECDDDVHFLGRYEDPSALTEDDLDAFDPATLAGMISETEMPSWVFAGLVRWPLSWFGIRDEAFFANQLDRCFLRPVGLGGLDHFFAFDAAGAKRIAASAGVAERDVRLPHSKRPFLIVGGTVRRYDFAPWKWDVTTNKRLPLEMTPMYVGTRKPLALSPDERIGDTYVEPALYGAKYVHVLTSPDATAGEPGELAARVLGDFGGANAPAFSLAKVLAVTGSAPAIDWLIERLAFPDIRIWSHLTREIKGEPSPAAHDYSNTDGGHSDNTGVLALIARRVPNLIVFVNSPEESGDDPYGLPSDVRDLFATPAGGGNGASRGWHGGTCLPPDRLEELVHKASAAHALAAPPVFCAHYTVEKKYVAVGDPFDLRVEASFDVNVAWVFLDQGKWFGQLPEGTQKRIAHHKSEFGSFPRYATFLNRWWYLIDMTRPQVNALANLTAWTLKENAKTIQDYFDDPHRSSFVAVGQQ